MAAPHPMKNPMHALYTWFHLESLPSEEVPQRAILLFCISFPWELSWSLSPVQCHEPHSILHQALYLSDLGLQLNGKNPLTTRLKIELRTWIDISLKKTYKWSICIGGPFKSRMFQNFHLFGNDLAIQYTVVTRIETRVTKTPGETFVSSVHHHCVNDLECFSIHLFIY